MSDIQTLAVEVRRVIADLPVHDAQAASSTLAQAHAGITTALRRSAKTGGAEDIARATAHIAAALRQLTSAADQLDRYLRDIGLAPGDGRGRPAETTEAAPRNPTMSGNEDWWRQRVNEISAGDAATAPGEVAMARLFDEMVDLARAGDRDGYRHRLLVAGARHGPRLAGLSWPMLRWLTADVLGHWPTHADDDKLRAAVSDTLRKVLPKLPEDVALPQLHGACGVPRDQAAHPVDAAAAGPALVAALRREREKTRKDT